MSGTIKGILTALTAFALFSTHDAIIKVLGETYSVFQIIFFAMLFAFVPMSMLMLADKERSNFRPRRPGLVLLRSSMAIVAMSGGFYAFTTLPLAEVYALLFATPLLVTALSVPLLGETVRLQRWAAVIVGLIGVLVVLRPGVTELSLGHLAALVAACANALATVLVRKLGGTERPAVLILYPMIFSMIAMSVMMPAGYQPVALTDLALMACVGLLSVLAQHCIIGAYRAAPAAVIAPIQYSQILWATAFGALFFMEFPDIYVGIGSSIIIASGLFVVWRESRENVSLRLPVLKTANPRFDTGPSPRAGERETEDD
ncbi:DMT family transporter [Roseibium denhamense]|uniref:Permease of the drug/metabolite transporter (DMT) superfamily n=1 Tax=Roseibium denhamense TaxID=76305 RepID=A0ABY1P6M0_9HYPH|nr:DMT family transporter [Roseibium denhamense]MTI07166.1 DMT family transporter [Roseibium denhamense]SMP26784.1 Permease of the drug/metabolite transporter (DMT) superfamily [Roseibium denhamense]